MSDLLPKDSQPSFADQIRHLIATDVNIEQKCSAVLSAPTAQPDQRFAALYAILQIYDRQLRGQEYRMLVDRYEGEFSQRPYFDTFRAVVSAGDFSSEAGLREAISHSDRAVRAMPRTPGVLHQYASLCAHLGELRGEVDQDLVNGALKRVEKAMRLAEIPTNPNFRYTRARLLRIANRTSEATIEIKRAIADQETESSSGVRRLATFESLRAILELDQVSKALLAEIRSARKDIEDTRAQQIQVLGLFAALFALLTTTVSIAGNIDSADAIKYTLVSTGAITGAFSVLAWSLTSSPLRRIIPPIALSFAIIGIGILWSVWG